MSKRSVSFSVNLETVIYIERLHASMIQCLHYQQEDYKRFSTEKLLEDIREAVQEERKKRFVDQKAHSKSRRQSSAWIHWKQLSRGKTLELKRALKPPRTLAIFDALQRGYGIRTHIFRE
jgi:hypothetical protein